MPPAYENQQYSARSTGQPSRSTYPNQPFKFEQDVKPPRYGTSTTQPPIARLTVPSQQYEIEQDSKPQINMQPQKSIRSRHAAVKDYPCPIRGCGRNFYHKGNMRRHIKQNHSLMEMSKSGLNVSF